MVCDAKSQPDVCLWSAAVLCGMGRAETGQTSLFIYRGPFLPGTSAPTPNLLSWVPDADN